MTRSLRLMAFAKINWSLEVLRIRPDGYHELRSVLQTIDLHDVLTLTDGGDITLDIQGETGALTDLPLEENLAYRAAVALRDRTGTKHGAHITLEKHIPIAAGLGGGSSDAAAVLRGLNAIWDSKQPDANLIEIAGELGSDPPFFVAGGTAAVSGRGDHIEPLRDAIAPSILLAIPPEGERTNKTAAMFDALSSNDFADGYVTIGVRETVRSGRAITDAELNNVFERVTGRLQPQTELAMDALRAEGYMPHLAGAGPSYFLLYAGGADLAHDLSRRVRDTGFEPRTAHAITRERALSVQEL